MKSKAIAILGMHRSGTSLITRVINLLGAYLGETEELKSPSPVNPEGFWERIDIKNLNEKILRHFRLSWQSPAPLPDDWRSVAQSYKSVIRELVTKHFSDKPLWAWKDPRTTMLFPLWKDALDELGIDVMAVFVVRSPLDVARSLRKRDGFSIDKGLGIWFNYNLCGLSALKNVKTVFVSYDRFLLNWREEVTRLTELLGIEASEDAYVNIEKTIKPDLRHSHSTLEELEQMKTPPQVIELYRLLSQFSERHEALYDVGSDELIKEYMEEFLSYSRFYREDIEQLLRLRDLDARLKAIDDKVQSITAAMDGGFATVDVKLNDVISRLKHTSTHLESIDAKLNTMLESPVWKLAGSYKKLKGILVSPEAGKKKTKKKQ